jgi:hypothetical protein
LKPGRVELSLGTTCGVASTCSNDYRSSTTELTDGGRGYRVERVEQPPNPNAFGHAWVARLE